MNGFTQLQVNEMVSALRKDGWFVLSPDNELLKGLLLANEKLEAIRGLDGQQEALDAVQYLCQAVCYASGVLK